MTSSDTPTPVLDLTGWDFTFDETGLRVGAVETRDATDPGAEWPSYEFQIRKGRAWKAAALSKRRLDACDLDRVAGGGLTARIWTRSGCDAATDRFLEAVAASIAAQRKYVDTLQAAFDKVRRG